MVWQMTLATWESLPKSFKYLTILKFQGEMGQPCLRLQSVVWPKPRDKIFWWCFALNNFFVWEGSVISFALQVTPCFLTAMLKDCIHCGWQSFFQHTLMRPVSWVLKLTIQDSGRQLCTHTWPSFKLRREVLRGLLLLRRGIVCFTVSPFARDGVFDRGWQKSTSHAVIRACLLCFAWPMCPSLLQ